MPVRAILFDLDNTLVMEDAATFAALRRASEVAGPAAGALAAAAAETAAALFRDADVFPYCHRFGIWWGEALWGGFTGDAPGLRALRAFVPGFRDAVWRTALAAVGLDPERASELAAAFATARRSDPAVDPAATRTLDTLARRYRLGLVTNGAPDVQREKLEASGLAARFAAVVISAELGVGKPEPGIFNAAVERIGVAASDAVMVGDSGERDVAGARAAGLRTVWLDRDGAGDASEAVVRITRLDELPAAIDAIGVPAPAARSA